MHWIKAYCARVGALIAAFVTGAAPQAQQTFDPDTAAWEDAIRSGNYGDYLQVFPMGKYYQEAFRRQIERDLEDSDGPATRGLSADLY